MDCTGITAEYNPFHKGHSYHISQTKALIGNTKIAAVMSGNFVQRGDIAIYDKFYRAKKALEGGADIVIELPTVFAVSCAERFAKAAVTIFEKSGIIKTLSFGSESADIRELCKIANEASFADESSKEMLRKSLKSGASFAKAQSEVFSIPPAPNDILGIEYIKALNALSSAIKPLAIQRAGAQHDGLESTLDGFYSASALRSMILNGEIKSEQTAVSAQASEFSSAVLFALRSKTKSELASLPDVSEGLENVIYSSCRNANSYSDFLLLAKSKRYTMARLRRIAICALLSITDELQSNALSSPEDHFYIRVLGVRKESADLLSCLAKNSLIPVITSYSDVSSLSKNAVRILEKDLLASDIYNIFSKKRADSDYTKQLIIV